MSTYDPSCKKCRNKNRPVESWGIKNCNQIVAVFMGLTRDRLLRRGYAAKEIVRVVIQEKRGSK